MIPKNSSISAAVAADDSEAVLVALRATLAELIDARVEAAKTTNAIRELPQLARQLVLVDARLAALREERAVTSEAEARIETARASIAAKLEQAKLHAV